MANRAPRIKLACLSSTPVQHTSMGKLTSSACHLLFWAFEAVHEITVQQQDCRTHESQLRSSLRAIQDVC